MSPLRQVVVWLWAAPNSLLGLTAGLLGLATGGGVQRAGPTLEFWGGGIRWALRNCPLRHKPSAMTLGHIIIAQAPADLERAREHERVHVRQYERWGPAFLPAYLAYWLILSLRGRDGYLENPFEVEAYSQTDK